MKPFETVWADVFGFPEPVYRQEAALIVRRFVGGVGFAFDD